MLKPLAAALALAGAAVAQAGTAVGTANLVDTATVHDGTVGVTSYLQYVSGGNGAVGVSDGSTWGANPSTPAQAMAAADHIWLQYDPAIFMTSGNVALNAVLAVPAIDHGWTADNTGQWWEPFEFRILGCTAPTLTACTEEGHITHVYTRGVDDAGAMKNADDFASVWQFTGSYTYFAIVSGDRLTGGPFSPGEGEIDALAVAAVPEPGTYALMLAGLAGLAAAARRRRRH